MQALGFLQRDTCLTFINQFSTNLQIRGNYFFTMVFNTCSLVGVFNLFLFDIFHYYKFDLNNLLNGKCSTQSLWEVPTRLLANTVRVTTWNKPVKPEIEICDRHLYKLWQKCSCYQKTSKFCTSNSINYIIIIIIYVLISIKSLSKNSVDGKIRIYFKDIFK